MGRGEELSVDYPHEVSLPAVVGIWAAAALASWVLVAFAVVGLWRLVT